ncbi:head GIN domain-containing protein [Lutibacter sp. TH_r2]|uniref:head GIN domain-containing protein n=1 Tax=Lutibacter sp. TH_r2 TaxID=3082083 RepID=UPI002955D6CA|nr:head GIN domain-containing protein [Lutibacter sp. TH_r2]MDV7187758.1 head GIN domain-containing protein [Lutibacter sp. TH_r2]
MKKNILYILLVITFYGCNNKDASDCFQTTGTIIFQEIDVPSFSTILVQERVGLVIEEGPTQKVVIETGENLLPDVSVEVIDNEIILKDNNACNFVRDYGVTVIHITSPNITKIRNASEQDVNSKGVLTYPSLYLQSVGEKTEYLAAGDFNLNISNENLKVWGNAVCNFNITGTSNKLDLNLSDGDTRFNGSNFIVSEVIFNQVSSNDILIYPTESIKGNIYSTGDVICYNTPTLIDVEEISGYGKLIFK